MDNEADVLNLLKQFLIQNDFENVERCLMILAPELFQPSQVKKGKKSSIISSVEDELKSFYEKLFLNLNTIKKEENL